MMDAREQALQQWLKTFPQWREGGVTALAGDASFRRYFRWTNGEQSVMMMDAPPPKEDVRPFLQVQSLMQTLSIDVPKVWAADDRLGFVALEDFGDTTLALALNGATEAQADAYYQQALSQLSTWQTHPKGAVARTALPHYDAALLVKEMQLLPEWLLAVHFDAPMSAFEQAEWQQWLRLLSGSALAQPQTLVHRDYHSRNLMLTPSGRFGIIDFQDAVQGALTYDAVSLLRDAYVQWPDAQVTEWLRYYFLLLVEHNVVSLTEWSGFVKAFDWMGIQRHIKVLGIFARLYRRDGKSGYLADLPLVAAYVQGVSARYPELHALANWCEQRIQARLL
jgi:aminoglycoside/choline kinase family phosphotransferase